jgi:hypothetical protein
MILSGMVLLSAACNWCWASLQLLAVRSREDALMLEWESLGASLSNLGELFDIAKQQRSLGRRRSANTDDWRRQSGALDNEFKNKALNVEYTLHCLTRITGHWTQDDWEYELRDAGPLK